MNTFPIFHAAYTKPFVELAFEKNNSMSNVLKQLKLEEKTLQRTDLYLPSHVFGIISNAAATITETDDIALVASQIADSQVLHPSLYRQINESKTLAQALNAIFAFQHLQGSDFKIWIEYVDGELRICHRSSLKASNRNSVYAAEFAIFLLLRVLRKFYGEEWRPKYLAFQHHGQTKSKIAKQTLNNQILYGAKSHYIPIEISPSELKPFELDSEVQSSQSLRQIKQVIDAFWQTEVFGLDFISHLFGVSERSIQRLFIQHNATFRDYVNRKKIDKSIELLKAGLTVEQVAEKLHYSDAPTFARAMRKQVGMSPTQYMKSQAKVSR